VVQSIGPPVRPNHRSYVAQAHDVWARLYQSTADHIGVLRPRELEPEDEATLLDMSFEGARVLAAHPARQRAGEPACTLGRARQQGMRERSGRAAHFLRWQLEGQLRGLRHEARHEFATGLQGVGVGAIVTRKEHRPTRGDAVDAQVLKGAQEVMPFVEDGDHAWRGLGAQVLGTQIALSTS
jgi:hypothetical protein